MMLKHTVLPYIYFFEVMHCAPKTPRENERLNTGRKKLFTARLGPKTRLGAKVFVAGIAAESSVKKKKKKKKRTVR